MSWFFYIVVGVNCEPQSSHWKVGGCADRQFASF